MSILLIGATFLLSFYLKGSYKLFPIVLSGTGFFYAILGNVYWTISNQGYFAGVDWSEELTYVVFLFSLAIFLTGASYFAVLKFKIGSRSRAVLVLQPNNVNFTLSKFVWLLVSLGFFSSIFVFLDNSGRGPLFLIAYQFSDVTIAALVFLYVVSPKGKVFNFLIVFFILYCLFVGFRYKLILLFFPIYIIKLYRTSQAKRLVYGLLAPLLLLMLFSIITVVRVKFSGLNFEKLEAVDKSVLLYGLFADTNILFGLCSIVYNVLPSGMYVGLDPIRDIFIDLVPRFLLPDKSTGSQIGLVLNGLHSEEGINSATTYPYFGEYLLMYGYTGYFVGSCLLGALVGKLVASFKSKFSVELALAGISLISVMFGYYYVSRGYLPQFGKSIIFVLVPFYLMCRQYKKRYLV